ncbi:MAG: hypothetical protein JNL98_08405 [Bryobacterales bacterium]|nr:hypothetical protein [Bryobacterales bacterium]
MKNRRAIMAAALVAFGLVATGVTANAQEGRRRGGEGRGEGRGERMAEMRVNRMKEELKLSDEQTAKVKTIFADEQKQMLELREKHKVEQGQQPSEEARQDMMKVRGKTMDSLKEVLSEDQMKQYTKMQREMMQRAGEGKGRRKGN